MPFRLIVVLLLFLGGFVLPPSIHPSASTIVGCSGDSGLLLSYVVFHDLLIHFLFERLAESSNSIFTHIKSLLSYVGIYINTDGSIALLLTHVVLFEFGGIDRVDILLSLRSSI